MKQNSRGVKGQAAMEYLMTYGWALLVIVIVIAILLIINPFSAPQGCRFDQIGFTCNNPVITTDGMLFMSVTNGNNNAIELTKIVCTPDRGAEPPEYGEVLQNTIILQRQGILDFGDLPSSKGLQCMKGETTEVDNLQAGAEFTGKVWLFYRNEEDSENYPLRTSSANIVTSVVKATTE